MSRWLALSVSLCLLIPLILVPTDPAVSPVARVIAQAGPRDRPVAMLEPAPNITFPSATDSNSPAFWQVSRGQPQLAVINSAPTPILTAGPNLEGLDLSRPTVFRNEINGSRWIESVVPDEGGRLYGFYHNEPNDVCEGDLFKTAPRIGAARSTDAGRSWIDLGIVLESAPGLPHCETPNRYFAGGVGDFTAVRSGLDLYFLFSAYGPTAAQHGVAIGRMLWADRDRPRGRLAVWSDDVWRYPEWDGSAWVYPAPTPILPARGDWHDTDAVVDAFWGPSVHWNTYLKRYVMLLNRATDLDWNQEGVYLTSTTTLDNPRLWSPPQKILDGGQWYPQVVGTETGLGTDRLAGQRARFFMGGTSDYEIVFRLVEGIAVPRR